MFSPKAKTANGMFSPRKPPVSETLLQFKHVPTSLLSPSSSDVQSIQSPSSRSLKSSTKLSLARNARGGIKVSREEIQIAMQTILSMTADQIDINSTKDLKVSITLLKKKLSTFYPDITIQDCRFLLDEMKEISVNGLYDLLIDNEVQDTGFDPSYEAFRLMCSKSNGEVVNIKKLQQILESFWLDELSREELEAIIKSADKDADGQISFEDFKQFYLTFMKSKVSKK